MGTPVPDFSGNERFPNGVFVDWKTAEGRARADIVGVQVPRLVPDAEARRAIRPYHPADARPVRSYVRPGARVEVFQSDALARVFAAVSGTGPGNPVPFGNNPPGIFSEYVTGAGPIEATHAVRILGTLP